MTKVTTHTRKRAAATTVGLATVGSLAGAVPAHAADTTSFPVTTNITAVTGLLTPGSKSARPLESIPVLGTLVASMTDAAGPAPAAAADASQPQTRSVPAMPVTPVMPTWPDAPTLTGMSAAPSSPYVHQSNQAQSPSPSQAADSATSSALTFDSLGTMLPQSVQLAHVDGQSLPLQTASSADLLGNATSVMGLTSLL